MKRHQAARWLTVIACAPFVAACGTKPTAAPSGEQTAGEEREEEPASDSLSVEGLRGALSKDEVQNALEPRMPKFARCLQQRSEEVPFLAGHVAFEFHVNVDGTVAGVYLGESSLGDHIAERCLLTVAQATRFPRPRGGEADFGWSFDVPLDESVREPVALGPDALGAALERHVSAIQEACGMGSYYVTAYVDPDGKVLAAGVAAGDEHSAAKLDCVAEAAKGLTFESPGSYAAKVSFPVR